MTAVPKFRDQSPEMQRAILRNRRRVKGYGRIAPTIYFPKGAYEKWSAKAGAHQGFIINNVLYKPRRKRDGSVALVAVERMKKRK